MKAGAALARNFPTAVSGPSGAVLHVLLADAEQHGLHALLLDGLAVQPACRAARRRGRWRRRGPRTNMIDAMITAAEQGPLRV